MILYREDFATEAGIRGRAVGIDGNTVNPLVPSRRIEYLNDNGLPFVRVWASHVGNPLGTPHTEKLVAWWYAAEPKQAGARAQPWHRDYGDGYTHAFVRYLIRIGEDVAANAGILAGKFPGMTGTYDIQAAYTTPPAPRYSRFATFECRHGFLHTDDPAWRKAHPSDPIGKVALTEYYYGVRAPRTRPDVPGLPASLGRYDGQGTPGGPPITSGFLTPGRWHCIEQEIKLNSVRDRTLFLPGGTAELPQHEQMALDNAIDDGELRTWLDGVLVYENVRVAFRGLDCVRIQSIPFVNIYQGGRGNPVTLEGYPKGPEHYDLAAMVASLEYIGPPSQPQQPQPGDDMATITIFVPTGTVVTTVESPDGKPPTSNDALVAALRAENTTLRGAITTLQQRAQARKDADNAKVEGQDDLDLIASLPPPTGTK